MQFQVFLFLNFLINIKLFKNLLRKYLAKYLKEMSERKIWHWLGILVLSENPTRFNIKLELLAKSIGSLFLPNSVVTPKDNPDSLEISITLLE